MSTTSTYPAFKTALLTALTAAMPPSVTVDYAWNPDVGDEAVFLGRSDMIDTPTNAVTTIHSEIPTIKSGRKQRQESYPVEVTVWTFRPDVTAAGAAEAEARLFVLVGALEDVLAADVQVADVQVQHAVVSTIELTLIPFELGWACVALVTVDVEARLT